VEGGRERDDFFFHYGVAMDRGVKGFFFNMLKGVFFFTSSWGGGGG
jgi:hypothetical protein